MDFQIFEISLYRLEQLEDVYMKEHEAELTNRTPAKKTLLTREHKVRRFQFCKPTLGFDHQSLL